MENKVGYVMITIEEYREIIEDNQNKAECIRELNIVDKEEKKINKKLEEYFFKRIIENKEYHIQNMKEVVVTDYHYQELFKCFLEIGIDNVQYIHTSIQTIKHIYEKENEE